MSTSVSVHRASSVTITKHSANGTYWTEFTVNDEHGDGLIEFTLFTDEDGLSIEDAGEDTHD